MREVSRWVVILAVAWLFLGPVVRALLAVLCDAVLLVWNWGRPEDERPWTADETEALDLRARAARLSEALGNAPIVETDDFATGEPGEEWWPRLQRGVIQPLASRQPARYQRYDWKRRAFAEWRQIPAAPVVIIEGVSSARRAIAPHLALAV